MDASGLAVEWVRGLEPYAPGKPIEELEREYGIRGAVKLASNENPLGPSPRAVEAMRAALGQVHRYPDGGCFRLRRALAGRLRVAPENLIFGNGSNEIIDLVVRAFLRPGDHAVFADRSFAIYRLAVQAQGGSWTAVPLRDHTHDLEAIASAIGSRTRVVFLANPNNPTGTIFRHGEWERFVERLPPSVVVVVDEAYGEYVADPEYARPLANPGLERPLLVLRTFSKIHGLAGLRIGYGIGPAALVSVLDRVRAPFNVNALAQAAAVAALEDRDHVETSRRANREGMRALERALEGLGVGFVPSQANFLLVRVGDGAAVYDGLLRRGVIVRPMAGYGYPECVRVTVGRPQENRRFVEALREVLAEQADGSGG